MEYIDSLKEFYCIREKANTSIYVYDYGEIVGTIGEIEAKEKEDIYFSKVIITRQRYRTKLAVSKLEGHKEAMYVLTNGKEEEGIKNYSYRFGSIEFIFKNEKTNGFYLEKTKMKNLQAFKTMFGLMLIGLLWLTILGVDYCVNMKEKANNIKIRCYKKNKERIFSLFNTGLFYFNLCFNSYGMPKIKCNFLLYEL